MEEANKLIGAGKKQLVMGKVVEAAGVLQEACGLLAKKYGDTADECGEAFFWCGKALLDLARMENTVLGNALEGVPEEDEEEEKPKDSNVESTENIDEKTRDELRVQVYDAMAEKKSDEAEKKSDEAEKKSDEAEKKSDEAQTTDEKKNGDVEKKPEAGEEKQNETKEDEVDENKPDQSDKKETKEEEETAEKPDEAGDDEEEEDGEDAEMEGDGEEQGEGTAEKDSDDEEEVGNLQLAWEMLEIAKVIYKRKQTKDDQLMAAQAHLKLGEVSAESGNYTQAVEDFEECLKLQLEHLDSDSRLLAETHYQLGLTYALNREFTSSIEALNRSIAVIKSRLEKLQQLLDGAGPEDLADERKEMEELETLLPEIREKVEDSTEGLKTLSAGADSMMKSLDRNSSSVFPGSSAQNGDVPSGSKVNGSSTTNGHDSTAPVSDISHLVRKKRKPDESPEKEGLVKKVKQDDVGVKSNGHSDAAEEVER